MVEYDRISGDSDVVEKVQNASMDMEFGEWLELVSDAFNSSDLSTCEKVDLFSPPIEAYCIDDDIVEVIGTVDISDKPNSDLKAAVEHVVDGSDVDPFNMAIGVHETTMESANSILDEGIEPWMEKTTRGFSSRNGSVFFWIHTPEVGDRGHEHSDGVVALAPAEHVRVSSYMNETLLSEGYITPQEYDDHHTVAYMDYVDCLGQGHKPDMVHGLETLF